MMTFDHFLRLCTNFIIYFWFNEPSSIYTYFSFFKSYKRMVILLIIIFFHQPNIKIWINLQQPKILNVQHPRKATIKILILTSEIISIRAHMITTIINLKWALCFSTNNTKVIRTITTRTWKFSKLTWANLPNSDKK